MNRRSLRFTLRSLLLLITLTALWLGVNVHRANQQRRAVQRITQRGGNVRYDYQFAANGNPNPNLDSSHPAWLRRFVGDDFLHNVESVGLDFLDDPVRDEDLRLLKHLPRVRLLYLGGGKITDDGLAHLQHLRRLELLVLAKNPITGEGIPYLARLPRLEWIDLSWTKVDDAHLAGLARLMALRRIDLTNNPQVNGSFLRNVVALPHLETLVLRHSAITDESLNYLKDAVSLQSLMIDSTAVTNAGLPHLAVIPTLRDIDLSNTAVTRTALRVLAEHQALTSVTFDGVELHGIAVSDDSFNP